MNKYLVDLARAIEKFTPAVLHSIFIAICES